MRFCDGATLIDGIGVPWLEDKYLGYFGENKTSYTVKGIPPLQTAVWAANTTLLIHIYHLSQVVSLADDPVIHDPSIKA